MGTRAEPQYEARTECVEEKPYPLVYFGAMKRSDDDGEHSNFSPVTDVQVDTEYDFVFTTSEQDDDVEQKNDEDDCSTVE